MKITIPHKAISWNKLYEQRHWSYRKRLKDTVYLLVREQMNTDIGFVTEPVNIHITGRFKSRPLDADNICAKLYIDALVGLVIENDDPRYVRSVTLVSAPGCERDETVIEVREIKP